MTATAASGFRAPGRFVQARIGGRALSRPGRRISTALVVDLDVAVDECPAGGVSVCGLYPEGVAAFSGFVEVVDVDSVARRGAVDGCVPEERSVRPALDERRRIQALELCVRRRIDECALAFEALRVVFRVEA